MDLLDEELFAELVANDRPLLLSYRGELHSPLTSFYTEEYFGGEYQTEPDYTDPVVKCLIRTGGNLDPCFQLARIRATRCQRAKSGNSTASIAANLQLSRESVPCDDHRHRYPTPNHWKSQ